MSDEPYVDSGLPAVGSPPRRIQTIRTNNGEIERRYGPEIYYALQTYDKLREYRGSVTGTVVSISFSPFTAKKLWVKNLALAEELFFSVEGPITGTGDNTRAIYVSAGEERGPFDLSGVTEIHLISSAIGANYRVTIGV